MAPRGTASPLPHGDSDPAARRHIEAIAKASKVLPRNRTEEVKPSVEKLNTRNYERGVLPGDLDDLIDVLTTPNFLDQASLNSILRSLYPASTVSGDVLVKVVGALGHGKRKPSLAIQGALLRWLIMIHHVIDNSGVLSQSYSLLFNLLDTAAIRTHICHILALITRRRHVRPHRIQSLLSLARQTGNDQALTGLLRVYKNYYPEIVVGEAVRGKASTFAHPDPQWRDRLAEIQQAHAERTRLRSEQPLSAYQVSRNNGKLIVPEVHSSRATENSVTLEEIESADGLVDKLDRLEFPDQLIAVLGDPLLQKLFLLKPDAEATTRASLWLASYAEDVLRGEANSGIFQIVQSYLAATKVMPPVILAFLSDYLHIWDGHEDRAEILDILTYLPMLDFQDLLSAVFQPLEARILDGTVGRQIDLLNYYGALFRRWRIALTLNTQQSNTEPQKAAALIEAMERRTGMLALAVLQAAAASSSSSAAALSSRPSDSATRAADAVLNFYEETASLAVAANSPEQQQPPANSPLPFLRIVIPPKPVVYLLAFLPCPSVLSRICGVLAQYKTAFSHAQQQRKLKPGSSSKASAAQQQQQYPSAYVDEFNGFLMDMCNLIWRSRAFGTADANAHGCLLDAGVGAALAGYIRDVNNDDQQQQQLALTALYSFSYSPVLGGFAASRVAELEDQEAGEEVMDDEARHAGPVTKASLRGLAGRGGMNISWEDFRVEVLEDLTEAKGMGGIAELLYSTMTTLAGKRP
ncbi:Mis6-domain-containing protein [Microdochium trichocladiopsis]|uniref:Mis6-domain-containing protein n=1 Tax=Microdochium trichocladiopsis TaxID=1682393 RepID=A0A9P9BRY5_9PEZI|nr:Mis6-domain-containing protein [Microdochium trichocladiopsis]KAH7033208.1 Mis6-domain-containing protein [Microdochium trichocladiopsis]